MKTATYSSGRDNASPEQRLKALGITLPILAAPAAKYVPSRFSGNQLVISGQLPVKEGKVSVAGHLGKDVSLEKGQEAARICAINILAQANSACQGDLSRIRHVVKLEILVSSTPDFTEPHVVANGASQVMLDVFGENAGSHARVAYGVSVLPLNAAVEVAAIFEIA